MPSNRKGEGKTAAGTESRLMGTSQTLGEPDVQTEMELLEMDAVSTWEVFTVVMFYVSTECSS